MDKSEIQAKYQKLATEYSKVRAQNQVLKKAVVEEQEKSNNVKENLKLKNQSIRKLEQELDSTMFRNQQLSKRLMLLQEELDSVHVKGNKKHQQEQPSFDPSQNVFFEELQLKIDENVNLHARLSEIEDLYKSRISELENELHSSKYLIERSTEEHKTKEDFLKEQIRQLENEKIVWDATLQQKQAQLSSMHMDINSTAESPKSLELISQVSSTHKLERAVSKGFVKGFESPISCLCTSFSKFLKTFSSTLSSSSSNVMVQQKTLLEEENVWHELNSAYGKLVVEVDKIDNKEIRPENLFELQNVAKAITNCAASMRKLLPILTEKIHSNHKSDASWRIAIGRFVSCWASLTPHFTSLSSYSEKKGELNVFNAKMLSVFDEKVQKLLSSSQDLLTSWEEISTELTKPVDESLLNIYKAIENISIQFSCEVASFWSQELSSPSSPSSVSTWTPINTHPPTFNLISQDPSRIDLPTQISLVGSEDSISQQFSLAHAKIAKLEEEKEHWKLEYQLLNHKLQGINISNEEATDTTEECQSPTSIISESIIAEVHETNWNKYREKEIVEHYTNRLDKLYKRLNFAISQAALYQNECETIIKRLALIDEDKKKSEQESESLRKRVGQLKELLQTTSRNYEEQISTMSEHLADLNEKLTSQQEVIEDLLHHQKIVKKTKK